MSYTHGGLGPDTSFSAHNTIVTAGVAKAIRRLKRGEQLDDMARNALAAGAILISNIIQGSVFIEGHDVGALSRPTSTEDVWAYSHALAVLQQLNVHGKDEVTQAFQTVKDTLQSLSNCPSTPPANAFTLDALERLFNTLNGMFYTDIYNGLLPTHGADDEHREGAHA
jgi:hypothetical protein